MKIRRHVIRSLCLFGLWFGVGLQVHAQTDTVTYVYTDPHGTPLVKADASGNVIARYDYTPYGNSVASLGSPPNGPGYTGHVNDPETGLVYMQARYYQPTGRFLSPDPVDPAAGNVYSFNRYAYAFNNPINRTDPDGRDSVGENIDQNAQAAADRGDHVATYLWAFAGTAWTYLGAESVSQVADKGSAASTSDKVMAVISIATLGKGEEAATVAKDAEQGIANAVKSSGTLYHYTDAAGADGIKASGKINADSAGRVYLTTDKIAAKDANNALFMGQGGSKGTHVVEVNMKAGAELKPGTQPNELIHQGAVRDGRQADLTVKENDN